MENDRTDQGASGAERKAQDSSGGGFADPMAGDGGSSSISAQAVEGDAQKEQQGQGQEQQHQQQLAADVVSYTQAAATDVLGALNEAMSSWLGFGASSAATHVSADGVETTLVPGGVAADRAGPSDSAIRAEHMDQAAKEILAGFQKQFEALTQQVRAFTSEEQRELLKKQSEALIANARDAIHGLDTEKLQQQTREFIAHAQSVVSNEGSEDPLNNVDESELKAPWDTLGEGEQVYADKLREESIKLVVDCIYSKKYREKYFLSGLDVSKVKPFPMTLENRIRAKGALSHDKNLARLFAGMVPKYIPREEDFWAGYFHHVERILALLVEGKGELKRSEKDIEEEKAIHAEVSEEKRRDWDTEIDEIFS